MSISEIKNNITTMTRLERDEILKHILRLTNSDELVLPSENEAILTKRVEQIDSGEIKLLEGERVMNQLAKKYLVKT